VALAGALQFDRLGSLSRGRPSTFSFAFPLGSQIRFQRLD